MSKVVFLQHSPMPASSECSPFSAASMAGLSAPSLEPSHPPVSSSNVFLPSQTRLKVNSSSTQFPQLGCSFLKPAEGRPTPPDPQAENEASVVTHPHPTSPLVMRVSATVASLACLPGLASNICRRLQCYSPPSSSSPGLFAGSEPPGQLLLHVASGSQLPIPTPFSIPPYLPDPSVPEALTLTAL